MADVNLPGNRNWMHLKHFREVIPRCVHRTNKTIVATTVAPIAAAKHSMVGWAVLDMALTDKKLQMRQGKPGQAGSDRDIHNPRHCPTHGGLIVPATSTDVRTRFVVGEGRQGGKTRRSGDACDSLVL